MRSVLWGCRLLGWNGWSRRLLLIMFASRESRRPAAECGTSWFSQAGQTRKRSPQVIPVHESSLFDCERHKGLGFFEKTRKTVSLLHHTQQQLPSISPRSTRLLPGVPRKAAATVGEGRRERLWYFEAEGIHSPTNELRYPHGRWEQRLLVRQTPSQSEWSSLRTSKEKEEEAVYQPLPWLDELKNSCTGSSQCCGRLVSRFKTEWKPFPLAIRLQWRVGSCCCYYAQK